MGEKRNACRLFVGKPAGNVHWEDLDIGWWKILRRILER
jgi:hypothetical protein